MKDVTYGLTSTVLPGERHRGTHQNIAFFQREHEIYGNAEQQLQKVLLGAKANWNRTFGIILSRCVARILYGRCRKILNGELLMRWVSMRIPQRRQNFSGRISYDYKTVILLTRISVTQVLLNLKKENDSVSFLPLLPDGFLPPYNWWSMRNCLGSRS